MANLMGGGGLEVVAIPAHLENVYIEWPRDEDDRPLGRCRQNGLLGESINECLRAVVRALGILLGGFGNVDGAIAVEILQCLELHVHLLARMDHHRRNHVAHRDAPDCEENCYTAHVDGVWRGRLLERVEAGTKVGVEIPAHFAVVRKLHLALPHLDHRLLCQLPVGVSEGVGEKRLCRTSACRLISRRRRRARVLGGDPDLGARAASRSHLHLALLLANMRHIHERDCRVVL
mmetsp:Transcript_16940/g.43521  ORF Transcript_16940/g.43521 Transcript_16940/m.43521 type:complete len:233 (-) Transcript_16940:366-1064(-)